MAVTNSNPTAGPSTSFATSRFISENQHNPKTEQTTTENKGKKKKGSSSKKSTAP
jgi:hypothetical protein